jgi:hypothetical protein
VRNKQRGRESERRGRLEEEEEQGKMSMDEFLVLGNKFVLIPKSIPSLCVAQQRHCLTSACASVLVGPFAADVFWIHLPRPRLTRPAHNLFGFISRVRALAWGSREAADTHPPWNTA